MPRGIPAHGGRRRTKRNAVRLTHNGKTKTIEDWTLELGFAHSTIRERLRKGWSVAQALTPSKGYRPGFKPVSAYRARSVGNGHRLEHILIAEKALGKSLPKGAEVHHVDGNGRNNAPENLVVCPDRAYHALLHVRQRALEESGDANNRKCMICKQWDRPENLYISRSTRHRECHRIKEINRRSQ